MSRIPASRLLTVALLVVVLLYSELLRFDALFKSTDPSNVRKNPNSDLALVINLAATGKIGQAMQGKLQATGGTPPYTFKVTSAPPWLTTDAAGNLTGTPTIAGNFTVEGSVTDGKTTVATKSLTIDVT